MASLSVESSNDPLCVLDNFITDFDLDDDLMEQACASGECRSCLSTVPHGQDVCSQCKDFAFCPQCNTWLPPRCFNGSINCSGCVEKQLKPLRKSAFGGIIAELQIGRAHV